MSHASFVPLALPQRAQPAAAGFQPLSAAAPAPAAPAVHPATHSATPPKVTLQREGDRVTHIRIECGCGEVIELACVY